MADDSFFKILKEAQAITGTLQEVAGEDKEKQKYAISVAIKVYRLGNKLSMVELANKLGVTKMEIIRWEKARNLPTKNKLDLLRKEGIIK
jgi:DNA-binding transcriptional regulator YiaG